MDPSAPLSNAFDPAHFDRLIAAGTQRIERVELNGRVFWIKRPETDKIKIWHRLQRLLARLARHEILMPTVSRGGQSTLRREIGKLTAFRRAGLRVPEIVHQTATAFIVTDLGPSLRQVWAAKRHDPATALVLAAAAVTLGTVHQAGLAHGRPYLRDLTWDGTRVGLIDLEEAPEAVMPLEAAQARDIWLLFIQLARYGKEDGLGQAWTAYEPFLSAERAEKLRDFLKFLRPVTRLFGPLLRRHGSRDVLSALKATAFLDEKLRG